MAKEIMKYYDLYEIHEEIKCVRYMGYLIDKEDAKKWKNEKIHIRNICEREKTNQPNG